MAAAGPLYHYRPAAHEAGGEEPLRAGGGGGAALRRGQVEARSDQGQSGLAGELGSVDGGCAGSRSIAGRRAAALAVVDHSCGEHAGASDRLWYRIRWIIEQVFRSLKSHGLCIEDSQTEEANNFTKLAMVALIAVVRSMQLVVARDGRPGQAMSDAVDRAHLPALQA
ncbi:MAG: transposase [Acetobacteraceae bacterium]|nr:transposase [Acetobacteraceae bacterium]